MSEQVKKVYCNDCRYYDLNQIIYECRIPENVYETYEKRKNIKYSKNFANIKNKNNDCRDYRRKWWKFWR